MTHRCPKCGTELPGEGICPQCGYFYEVEQPRERVGWVDWLPITVMYLLMVGVLLVSYRDLWSVFGYIGFSLVIIGGVLLVVYLIMRKVTI